MPETCVVDELHAERGELRFRLRTPGGVHELYVRTDAPVTPAADAALAISLMPAMRMGGPLELGAAISPRLLRTQREFQAIQALWSHGWPYGHPPLQEVDVAAPPRVPGPPRAGRGVAAFFSGGVDSWSTVLDHPDLTHLIFVRGFDLPPGPGPLADEVESRLRGAADELGLGLVVAETNLRELGDPLLAWETYYGCGLAAVALAHSALFERVLLPGWTDYATMDAQGGNPLVDHLWSTEDLEIAHDGARFSRMERVRRIAGHPVAQRTLRVCWRNPGDAYNCGRCRKCLLTMLALEAIGMREQVTAFPPELDLSPIDDLDLRHETNVVLWEDVLEAARAGGRHDLVAAIAPAVAAGKRLLGYPAQPVRSRGGPRAAAAAAEARARQAEAALQRERERAQRLERALHAVERSRSWTLTRPLRDAARRVRGG